MLLIVKLPNILHRQMRFEVHTLRPSSMSPSSPSMHLSRPGCRFLAVRINTLPPCLPPPPLSACLSRLDGPSEKFNQQCCHVSQSCAALWTEFRPCFLFFPPKYRSPSTPCFTEHAGLKKDFLFIFWCWSLLDAHSAQQTLDSYAGNSKTVFALGILIEVFANTCAIKMSEYAAA